MKETLINQKSIPPCQNACPVKTRARDYVRAVAMDKLEDAYALITENNPFPSVCGRVCMHPCEQSCRRKDVDEPISIATLKRYASDYVNENSLFLDPFNVKKSGKKVAIIGSGPSGLAAAVKLAEQGHSVEVYEKNPKAGGMLRYGIPQYRLPDYALDEDIKRIEVKGIKIHTNKSVGDDLPFKRISNNNHAVLVSVGLSESRGLPIEGSDSKGVYLAIDFLKACSSDEKLDIGKNVLVIGGGNVAIDVARSAKRLNPKAKVTMACLENAEEMPASPWEVEEAKEEGIELRNCMGPRKIEVKNDKACGMHFITCASVFDKEGRFNPQFIEDEKHYVDVDTVILSIGQQSNLSFLPEEFVNNARLNIDSQYFSVSDDGLFGCGEVATGPGAAISAIANGNEVAKIINQFLADKEISINKEEYDVVPNIPTWLANSRIYKKKRQKNDHLKPEKRIKTFKEYDFGLDKKHATKEALRCMDCGAGAVVEADKCIACLTCVRVCPFWVPEIDKETNVAKMSNESCQACGACASMCPAEAIDILGFPLKDLVAQVEEVAAKGDVESIGFICQTGKEIKFGNSHLIRVKCPIRIDDDALIKAFELGVKKVFITCHKDEKCRYIKGPEYVRQRVGYIKQVLENVGIGEGNIEVFNKKDKEGIMDFLSSKEAKKEVIGQ